RRRRGARAIAAPRRRPLRSRGWSFLFLHRFRCSRRVRRARLRCSIADGRTATERVAQRGGVAMSGLPMHELGRTGLQVTALGFGAMELRGEPRGRPVTPEQAQQVLNGVLDAGINYIDTSIDYGTSEEFIGRFLAHRRGEYILASKCGCVVGAPPPTEATQRFPHIF